MPMLSGYNIALTSGRDELEYYNTRTDGPSGVECYVESAAGKEFAIVYSDYNFDGTCVEVECYIDGNRIARKTAYPGKRRMAIWGMRTSATSKACFKFSEIRVIDDDEADGATGGPCMGLIEVRLHRVREEHRHIRNPHHRRQHQQYNPRPIALADVPLSEKSKKGGWHRITVGTRQVASAWTPSNTHTVKLDPGGRPFASFRFHYRPGGILAAEGIMPCAKAPDPTPVPDASRQPLATTDLAQSKIKSEPAPAATASGVPIEVIEIEDDEIYLRPQDRPRSPITVRDYHGEVIDLTLD
ncbi:hypothetical protein FA95DRAFT_1593604 [Auriscalpium vulgare]|uniref:Uncharacterized protein n=1 Tax=Auriscalpium vulgare TaxID=40419 RepID=A0ACB8S4G8_9AGAM|nr:hypothetical protein FA95DRAFT_1593604 [Auriscalpium vulgare]